MGAMGMGAVDSIDDRQHRVLVVDDDSTVAALVADFLEHVDDGLAVSYVTGPEQAIETLAGEQFDCLITDYEMPTVDGLTLLDRADHDGPAVLYTNRRDAAVAKQARQRDATYVRKGSGPDHYEALAVHIRRELST